MSAKKSRYQIPKSELVEGLNLWESEPGLSWEQVGERIGRSGNTLHRAIFEAGMLEVPAGSKRCQACRTVQSEDSFGLVTGSGSRRRTCNHCRAEKERARTRELSESEQARRFNQLIRFMRPVGD